MSIRSIRGAKARRFTAEESRRTSSIRGLRRVGVIAALGLATAINDLAIIDRIGGGARAAQRLTVKPS